MTRSASIADVFLEKTYPGVHQITVSQIDAKRVYKFLFYKGLHTIGILLIKQ